MDPLNDYGAPLSNVPPLAWLSGLNLGNVGMSGQQSPSLGGDAGAMQGGGVGMEGGLDLNALSELLQQTQGQGVSGNPADLFGGIGGTVGQGTLAQGGPGYSIAGGGTTQPQQQQQTGGHVAGQSQAGGIDPLQVIKQALGLTQKGVGIARQAGQSDGYQTAGDTGQGAIDPTGFSLTGPDTGGFEGLSKFFEGGVGGTSALSDPTLGFLFNPGNLMGQGGTLNENILASLNTDPALRQALFGGQVGGDLGETLMAPGGTAGFALGGDKTFDTSLGGGAAPTNWGGAAQGGLSGALGLVNLIQGLQGGNAVQGVGGGLQGVGGLAAMLGNSPQLAQSLGLTGSALGATGAATGGLGGLLGLYSGINAAQEGNLVGAATGIGGGALSTYQAIQMLSQLYPQLASTLSGGLLGGTSAAGAAGAAGAAAGGGAAGGTGAASAAGAGAGMGAAAGAGGVLAAAMAPLMIGSMIDGWDPWAEAIKGSMGSYPFFGASLGDTLLQEREGLGSLARVLPYVTSQEQLRQLLDQFKASQETQIGGYGEGSDPFTIPALPGAGGSKHEWGQVADFSQPVSQFNQAIQGLLPYLPETGAPLDSTLWTQALAQQRAGTDAGKSGVGYYAPSQHYVRMPDQSFQTMTSDQLAAAQAQNAQAMSQYTAAREAWLGAGGQGVAPSTDMIGVDPVVSENVLYGDPRYNYAAQGIPDPNWTPGQMSPAWQQLMGQMQPRPQMPQLPQAPAQDSAGLMALMQALAPAQQGAAQMSQQPVIDEETRRMLFAQYGINA